MILIRLKAGIYVAGNGNLITRSLEKLALKYNHRIIVYFGLEGTLKLIDFPSSAMGRATFSPDQVAQNPTEPGLEHFWGCNIHSFSGLPVPVSDHI